MEIKNNSIKRTEELLDALIVKNIQLVRQSQRIKLLESKMFELRRKYFQLKYAEENEMV